MASQNTPNPPGKDAPEKYIPKTKGGSRAPAPQLVRAVLSSMKRTMLLLAGVYATMFLIGMTTGHIPHGRVVCSPAEMARDPRVPRLCDPPSLPAGGSSVPSP